MHLYVIMPSPTKASSLHSLHHGTPAKGPSPVPQAAPCTPEVSVGCGIQGNPPTAIACLPEIVVAPLPPYCTPRGSPSAGFGQASSSHRRGSPMLEEENPPSTRKGEGGAGR
eukprot:GGOE01048511.1.p4 GENE.GGOE01048511.1~~GGOE01048511.1.p4  ORF type:complete len:112 (-),score=13.05 GGOE01048511.1:321-656(-)